MTIKKIKIKIKKNMLIDEQKKLFVVVFCDMLRKKNNSDSDHQFIKINSSREHFRYRK